MVRSIVGYRLAITVASIALMVSACSPQSSQGGPEPGAEEDETAAEGPSAAGEWKATCTDVQTDSTSLAESITGAINDPAEPDALAEAAAQAVRPLAECEPGFLTQLADHLSSAWEDGETSEVAAEAIYELNPDVSEVEHFTPFTADGRIDFAIVYPDPEQPHRWFIEGACHASPVASAANVYQCGTTADNLAACWRADSYGFGPIFACMHSPEDERVVFVMPTGLDGGSSPEPVEAYEVPSPWQVVLEDGSNCLVRLGGAWPEAPEGHLWSHGCEGGSIQGLVIPDSGSTLETQEGRLVALGTAEIDGDAEVVPTEVRKSVYAGEAIEPTPAQTGAACPPFSALEPALREIHDGLDFVEEIEPECVGDWVLTFAGDEMSANTQVFEQVDGAWRGRNSGKECTLPSPIPAALYAVHCMAG